PAFLLATFLLPLLPAFLPAFFAGFVAAGFFLPSFFLAVFFLAAFFFPAEAAERLPPVAAPAFPKMLSQPAAYSRLDPTRITDIDVVLSVRP
ncbi:MAG: hypothetical protein EBZ13_13800, partial [Planctomycetia bacterium]|nr:hypothetical protein [Planctomycetia bacterium]